MAVVPSRPVPASRLDPRAQLRGKRSTLPRSDAESAVLPMVIPVPVSARPTSGFAQRVHTAAAAALPSARDHRRIARARALPAASERTSARDPSDPVEGAPAIRRAPSAHPRSLTVSTLQDDRVTISAIIRVTFLPHKQVRSLFFHGHTLK